MVEELKLPELGENIKSAVVSAVLVKPGETVRKEQPVVEVETDKATAEVPSPFRGRVKALRVRAGDEVRVGQVLLTVELTAAQVAPSPVAAEPPVEPSVPGEPAPAASAATPKRKAPAGGEAPLRPAAPSLPAPAAPAARRLARELGVEIAAVRGTGPGGRISVGDVKAHAKQVIRSGGADSGGAPELPDFKRWGEVTVEPMNGVRRATAKRLSRSWSVIPHVTQFDRADITGLDSLRRRWASVAEERGGKLTVTAIVLKVAAAALRAFPRFNASLDDRNYRIILKRYVHVGVAVDAGHGLLVPVIRDADRKGILKLAVELSDLSRRAREKKLALEEMQGAGFTVSNLGGLGTTYFSPVVPWPQVAILGVGRAAVQPVYREGEFEPRLILPLSISYDHRLIDGADAARFLRWIAEALEHPLKLAMED